MKIATWNVNSIRSRLDHVTNWLLDNPVEVLCLQETKVIDADFPSAIFTELGYEVLVSGQKSYNGVAILSRLPAQNITRGFEPVLNKNVGIFDEQKRIIAATINDIRIVNVYVPNGSEINSDKYFYKISWLNLLQEYLQHTIGNTNNLCICGDFNIALEDKDIHNPKAYRGQIMASETERIALINLLNLGLADTFRKFTTETGHYSWWDYRGGSFAKNRGWRIDHIYTTENLYAKSQNCVIDIAPRKLEKPSDHTPVILSI